MNLSLTSRLAAGALLCAAGAATLAQPAVENVTVRSTAHFGFDRATVRPDDQAQLLAEVATMRDVSWQSVTATGHTDSVGPVAHNQRLAERRAQAVKDFLVGKGLEPAMIEIGAQAAEAPVAPNGTEAGRSRNRRTEVVFQGVRTKAP